jgi:hypothetical protein
MKNFLYFASFIMGIFSLAGLVGTCAISNGAPQQAAGAAVSVGAAVIPYCIARAWGEVHKD